MKIIKLGLLLVLPLQLACSPTQSPIKSNLDVEQKTQAMVVTANPLATAAGKAILERGGSAVDAAVAIESVLSLVEPQSSGLGGGGYLVHYDASTKKTIAYDGRETAPTGATPDMFLQDGKPLGYIAAKNSGLSTGVPGMVSMLALAHNDYGRLPWQSLFADPIKHAERGFAISPRLHGMLSRFKKYIPASSEQGPTDAYHYFYGEHGITPQVGDILKNPDYAKTLRLIAQDPANFYRGELAKEIVNAVSQQPRAGTISLSDIANYRANRVNALCSPYREYELCGPPPSSSWLAVAMIMGVIERSDGFSAQGAQDANNWALFADAQRIAYADRDKFVADQAFVDVPVNGLLNSEYLKKRANLLTPNNPPGAFDAGDPWAYEKAKKISRVGFDVAEDLPSTTHFVVSDNKGNVVSMTASVESIFGSTRMAGGMFLNNQLTDFSKKSHDSQGLPIANAVAPLKRPRSSMSPTIVLDKNANFVMATGSPGGNSIIAYTAKTLVGVLDWGLSPQQAVNLPNMVARGRSVRIEQTPLLPQLTAQMRDKGFNVKASKGENSGLSVILKHANGKLEGGVDLRREGVIAIVPR